MTTYNLRYRVTSIAGVTKEQSIKVDRLGIYHHSIDEHELLFERHGLSIPDSCTKVELADAIMGLLAKQSGVQDIITLEIVENLSKNT